MPRLVGSGFALSAVVIESSGARPCPFAGGRSNVAGCGRGVFADLTEGESSDDHHRGISAAGPWYTAKASSSSVRVLRQTCPFETVGVHAAHAYGGDRAFVWKRGVRCESLRPYATARWRTCRRKNHRRRASFGAERAAGSAYAHRNLAGQCRGTLFT